MLDGADEEQGGPEGRQKQLHLQVARHVLVTTFSFPA